MENDFLESGLMFLNLYSWNTLYSNRLGIAYLTERFSLIREGKHTLGYFQQPPHSSYFRHLVRDIYVNKKSKNLTTKDRLINVQIWDDYYKFTNHNLTGHGFTGFIGIVGELLKIFSTQRTGLQYKI